MLTKRVFSRLLVASLAIVATSCRSEDESRFDKLDRNHDGVLTPVEVNKPALFNRADADGDGAVTRAEARAFFAGRQSGAITAESGETSIRRVVDEPPAQPAPSDRTTGGRQFRDLPYATAPGADPNLLSLDVYAPPDDQKQHPVVIMIHGGGWRRGDKANASMTTSKVPYFTGAGYVYISINYRLSPGVRHPVHSQDVAKAVAWVHDHAARYGGDPGRIYLMGHSAGGHLASLVATDEKYLQAQGKSLGIVKGVILLDSGGYDIVGRMKEPGSPAGMRALYENAFGRDEKTWADASPARHVAAGKGIPPFLIFAIGRRSGLAESLVDSLKQAGIPTGFVTVPDKDHEAINNDIGRPGDGPTKLIMDFLRGKNPRDLPDSA